MRTDGLRSEDRPREDSEPQSARLEVRGLGFLEPPPLEDGLIAPGLVGLELDPEGLRDRSRESAGVEAGSPGSPGGSSRYPRDGVVHPTSAKPESIIFFT